MTEHYVHQQDAGVILNHVQNLQVAHSALVLPLLTLPSQFTARTSVNVRGGSTTGDQIGRRFQDVARSSKLRVCRARGTGGGASVPVRVSRSRF